MLPAVRAVSITFAGFTSRCTRPAAVRGVERRRDLLDDRHDARRDRAFPRARSAERRSVPSTQRMAMNSRPSDSPAS